MIILFLLQIIVGFLISFLFGYILGIYFAKKEILKIIKKL